MCPSYATSGSRGSVSCIEEIEPIGRLVFRQTDARGRGVCREEKEIRSRANRSGSQAGRNGDAGSGCDPSDGDFGADVLPLEKAVLRAAVGSGAGTEATAGRECSAEETGC